MSIYKSSTLAMIPTAYKDGKLYSVRPTDGSGDFTFSRGTTATRVDVNGLIEKGRENLYLRSEEFDNATWTKNGTSIVADAISSPVGTTTADKLVESTSSNFHICYQNTSITNGGVYTFSVYAKYNGRVVQLNLSSAYWGTQVYANFDLQNGVIGDIGTSTIDAQILSVGDGWYRCSITGVSGATGTGGLAVSLAQSTTSPRNENYTGDGTSGAYVWGAQAELGLVATDYIETTTTSVSAGILEDMPRLDYSGSCPSLLLEPQRSNLVNDYSGYTWDAFNGAAISFSGTQQSPEGLNNAVTWTFGGTSGQVVQRSSISISNTTAYTISGYFKLTSGTLTSGSNQLKGLDGLTGGSVSLNTLTSEWQRLSFSVTSSSTSGRVQLRCDNSATIQVYGLQLEAGSYETSIIPTYGASVTRSLDQCELFGMNAAGISTSNNWTYFIDVDNFESGQEAFYLRSTSAELMHLYHQSLGYRNSSNSSSYPASWSWSSYSGNNSQVKMCIRYDGSQLSVFINGSKKSDVIDSSSLNTSFNYPFDQDKFHFAGNSKWDTNQKAFYDTALTDSECIALTTI